MGVFLTTKRLILKEPELADFDELLALRTDPNVMRYTSSGTIETPEQVKAFLENIKHYSKKHNLSFYSVFEKETGNFVGQAGLFHLALDDKQKKYEIAYRLHKKYWGRGYATELAKALINYGFQKLSLPKIVAVLHPENERSRKVLEKAGMSYFCIGEYKGMRVSCYEIFNKKIDFSKITLEAASLNDYLTIQNMARFYVYDMSEYLGSEEGWEIPEDGLYACIDFQKYWEVKDAFPFLIKYRNEIAGFAIVDKKGSAPEIDFNMAQFFVLRKFKGQGIGRKVAQRCFEQFKGLWEVMVMPGNEGAYRFWRKTIKDYCGSDFSEYTREVLHFNNKKKNIFKFKS